MRVEGEEVRALIELAREQSGASTEGQALRYLAVACGVSPRTLLRWRLSLVVADCGAGRCRMPPLLRRL